MSPMVLPARVMQPPPSWFDPLESFQIPFVVYAHDGRRAFVSSSVETLSDAHSINRVLSAADQAVRGDGTGQVPTFQIGRFALIHQLEFPIEQLKLAIYQESLPEGNRRAIAVLRPFVQRSVEPLNLSRRESEVAHLIAGGLSTKQIAARLALSAHTVRHHTERIFARLGVTNRAAVAARVASVSSRVESSEVWS